tara:strand:- start:1924 stop:2223 length:300 start_codon:yes stop_codon:yes gene_type:complete
MIAKIIIWLCLVIALSGYMGLFRVAIHSTAESTLDHLIGTFAFASPILLGLCSLFLAVFVGSEGFDDPKWFCTVFGFLTLQPASLVYMIIRTGNYKDNQ